MHKTVAVIGHVDHGKTALVKTLTGTDTDRLEEERRRGLSIVLGFAALKMSDGWLHFVDAPGHADFIQTAAVGLSGADAILLVVDSTEGASNQTVEHLKLAQMFGIQDAIVALSKSDLFDGSSYGGNPDVITELLRKHGFNSPAVISCSSKTMEGIDRLKTALKGFLTLDKKRASPERFFMPIDRVFSADGAGTVVTGTLLGGELRANDDVIIQPKEIACSVRGLQVAGHPFEKALAGSRVAINLRGVKAHDIRKGDVLSAQDQGKPGRLFDVLIDVQVGDTRALTHMEKVTVLHGTRHSPARVRVLSKDVQGAAVAQLEFENVQIGFSGQRFVIRRPASFETVCGGQVLDAEAVLVKRNKDQHIAVLVAAANSDVLEIANAISARDRGFVDLLLLSKLARKTVDECSVILKSGFILGENETAYSVQQIETVKTRIIEITEAFHSERPLSPHAPAPNSLAVFARTPKGVLLHAVQSLTDENAIEVRLDGIALVGRDPNAHLSAAQRENYDDATEQLRQTGLMPELAFETNSSHTDRDDLINLMVWNGDVVRLFNHALNQTVILHSEIVRKAIIRLQDAFPDEQAFKTGEARTVLATNRKTIVPLLEHLDVRGITKRNGNVRVIKAAQALD